MGRSSSRRSRRQVQGMELRSRELESAMNEVYQILQEAGVTVEHVGQIPQVIRSLIQRSRGPAAEFGPQSDPASGSALEPVQAPVPVIEFDDPDEWVLANSGESVGEWELSESRVSETAAPVAGDSSAMPAHFQTMLEMKAAGMGEPSVPPPLDTQTMEQRLKARINRAETQGVKRGLPGAGGGGIGGGVQKMDLDQQRAILQQQTGKAQEAPPPGNPKPPGM